MKSGVEKTMSLEEYIDFFVTGKSTNFTIPYLNQILHFHGFRKLHKSHKKIVGEAVNALDLLDLSRSTLKQSGSSSSSASLTLEEVITDIEALKWQECCLTSLQIINSDQVTRSSVTKPKPKSNKRKKASMKKLLSFDDEDDDDYSAIPRKITTKKRSIRSVK
ncbi:hypothetical protein AALP_AA1G060600 [Arabis alpina]|uniref:DUF7787 domain-containing protein n=1 Tax=Arabis alpina TaxID=50452 RepID=A0A087HLF1_ARAAL|nr:hypothetical protein AALP_AA1G060600 [Arabis alpina]